MDYVFFMGYRYDLIDCVEPGFLPSTDDIMISIGEKNMRFARSIFLFTCNVYVLILCKISSINYVDFCSSMKEVTNQLAYVDHAHCIVFASPDS